MTDTERFSPRLRAMLCEMGIELPAPVASFMKPSPPDAAAAPVVAAPVAERAPTLRAPASPAALVERVSQPTPLQGVAPPAPQAVTPGAAGTLATLDWAPLREAVAACQACGLCRTRKQTVFGVGHLNAHWMVVGEAPGEEEDRQGEPFVGVSGQLLDRMLAALKLSRAVDGPPEQRVYIANTVKCRPPRNRNPEPAELAQCEPFLQRQIALVQPKIILAMGRFAVQSLLRSSEPIGKLRGRVHRYEGVPLVVTYHPAYLLRSLGEKARAWEDLCLAADTYEAQMRGAAARAG